MKKILKSEKREVITHKKLIKAKKGGTLAAQMSRLVANNFYSQAKTNKRG